MLLIMHRSVAPTLSLVPLLVLFACTLLVLFACTKDPPQGTEDEKFPDASADQATKQQAPTNKVPASPEKAEAAPRKTPYPSEAAWQEVEKEVTVKGSSALACETKISDGYLRVRCKKNELGAPTALRMKSALPQNALASTGDEALTLVHPFRAGTRIEATFSWEKQSHPFIATWPKGESLPEIVGVFEGAASPLDRLAPHTSELLALVAQLKPPPQECLGEVPMWGELTSYAKVVELGKKDFTPSSTCSPTIADSNGATGGLSCCVSFNEEATREDDEGYASSTAICFDMNRERVPNEQSLECHFAG